MILKRRRRVSLKRGSIKEEVKCYVTDDFESEEEVDTDDDEEEAKSDLRLDKIKNEEDLDAV